MTTFTRTATAVGTLFALTWGAAMALEVPRSPAENESVPQPPMIKAQTARLPERPTAEVHFNAPAPPTAFQELDWNRDGSITPLEAGGDLATDFAAWDSDGDGKLSRLEYARYRSDRGTLARSKSQRTPRDRY